MDLRRPWTEYSFVAFDTETSGAYPLGADIVEFGAVKWQAGHITSEYQTLLKPSAPIPQFIIDIHGITNEALVDSPLMKDKILEIRDFLKGSVLMAHHAPFDMGFLVADLERYRVPLPSEPVLCTSLLARKLIPESSNHKLQTLIKFLKLHQGIAHRATDDARACLAVGLECLQRLGPDATLEQAQSAMGKTLAWPLYCLNSSHDPVFQSLVSALHKKSDLDILYEGGSVRGSTRRITPIGIVRNPDGDFVMAKCHIDRADKRFYISKIKDATVVGG